MVPEILAGHFELLADAPNGVQKLRELVLQLAVHGKLIPQDPNDQAAAALLKEIADAGKRLAKAEGLAAPPEVKALEDGDVPFTLPSGWECVPLGCFGIFCGGGTPSKQNPAYWSGDIPWVSPKDMKRLCIDDAIDHVSEEGIANSSAKLIPESSLLMVVRGMILAHSFPVALTARELTINQDMKALRLFLPQLANYLLLACRAERDRMLRNVARSSHGTCRISTEAVATFPMLLPPLAEQHRIVAKVDQLMALCDELDQRQQERSKARVRLCTASHAALTAAGTPKQFTRHWNRIRTHFDLLYDTPETVQQLRQAIRELAVKGLLVPQVSSDEPASDMLERLVSEKQRLIEQKAIPKSKSLPPIAPAEVPFPLPHGWVWARFGDLASVVEYGTSQKASPSAGGVPVLRMGNIRDGEVVLDNLKYVPGSIDDLPRLYLKNNDLLFNRTNSYELVGKTGLFRGADNQYTFASYLIRAAALPGVNPDFVNNAMNAPYYRRTQIEPEVTQQCGQANFNGTKLKNSLVPLPPENEQVRIVARIDQFMAICDELESRLAQSQSDSEKLMEAVVCNLVQEERQD